MKRITTAGVLTALWVLGLAAISPAGAVTITDAYVGSDDHGWGDVIGSMSKFQIVKAEVNQSGNILAIDIHTPFAGNSGKWFTGLTSGNGIGYGDLFLSASWNPYDDPGDPTDAGKGFTGDDHGTGTQWTMGFSLDDRWSNPTAAVPGTGTLYDLRGSANGDNALLSDDFLTGGTYRNGQEIAVKNKTKKVGGGSWTVDAAKEIIQFQIDIGKADGIGLKTGVALHWGMTCGNDVIEGFAKDPGFTSTEGHVPAPATALLMVLGFTGLGFGRRLPGRMTG